MRDNFQSVGIGFGGYLTCSELLDLAGLAEKLNYRSLWIQEADERSSLALSAAVLHATRQLVVGTGITSPLRRHPQTLAIEAATLNELSNNRFILGVGAAERLFKSFRMRGDPLQAIRDTFAIIRGIFESDNFTYEGKVFALTTPQTCLKPKPRIYMGAIGPKMLDLAGELADGLLITRRGGFSLEYTKYAIGRVREKARAVGRDPSGIDFLGFFETSLSNNGDEAKRFAKKILATYTIPRTPQIVFELAGIPQSDIEKVKADYMKGDFKAAVNHVTDDLVDEFALAGTPDECLEKLRKYTSTGLKSPILYIHGPNQRVAAQLAAERMMPYLMGN